MGKVKDITGQRFGRLVVLSFSHVGKHRKIFWLCKCDCGNKVIIRGNAMHSGNTKSCGCIKKEVAAQNLPPIKYGKEVWNYREDLTQEERDKMRGQDHTNWSYAVKERDKFTCQVCLDDRGGNLVSHHIHNWADFKEKRFDLDNGICMCKKCHIKFHSLFGSRHNDEAQLSEFVELLDNGEI